MTAAVAPHHSDMDIPRVDDQMDLASSPALPTEDIDFDLDDVREISAEPNQDVMLQDEPDQPTADSSPVRSVAGDFADDDLMLDEDTLIQQNDQTDIPDLSMDNPQAEHVQINEDDDILYEDEEDPQEQHDLHQASSKEQQMEDGPSAEDEQLPEKVEIADSLVNEFEAEADIDNHDDGPAQGAEYTNRTAEQLQKGSEGVAVGATNDNEVGEDTSSNLRLEQQPDVRPREDPSGGEAQLQDVNEGHQKADIEGQQSRAPEPSGETIPVHEPAADDSKALDKLPEAQALGRSSHADPQALASSGNEEIFEESTTQSSLLHTVKIHYLETEMCLFPPTEADDSEMFFLQDVSLAHESLDKMLHACRDVLADTIGEDDELVLDVASLGLHISEGSRYATQITLSQIIDVYVSLAHNDKVTRLEPLYCSLHSRVCLASQYAYLKSAADEGKTLTQILEDKTFASGEDGEEEHEYEQVDANGQAASPEAEGLDKCNRDGQTKDASTVSEREISFAPKDALSNTANRGGAHGSDVKPSEHAKDDTVGRDEGTKEAEPRTKEQSPTSTVKGDANEIEGDYDIFLGLCFKPDICSCSSCANSNTDIAVSVSETVENGHPTREIDDFAKAGGDSSLYQPNAAADTSDPEKPEIESNVQESVSSKTLEAENNQVEEDLFSQDNDQSFNNGIDDTTGVQHDGAEDFELGEKNHRDTSGKLNIELSPSLDHLHGREDPGREYAAPSSTLYVSHEVGARHGEREENEGSAHAEGDDELLDFDDDEAEVVGQDKNEETFLSRDQITVSGNENIQGDTAGAFDDENSPSARNSSSGLVETRHNGSPVGQYTSTASTALAEEAPITPSGGKNDSKRKALDDEDEIDLLDAATPDKKRRRPS